MDSDLVIYYQNCGGLRTKLNALYMNILSNCYDIIILVETWLIPEISNNEFIDRRYDVFRRDRDRLATSKDDGGGVLIAVLKDLKPSSWEVPYIISPRVEFLFVEIGSRNRNSRNIINATYIPPGTNQDIYFKYFDLLGNVLNNPNIDTFIVVGDFNLKDLDWTNDPNNAHGLSCGDTFTLGIELANLMSLLGAGQYNHVSNSMGRYLDLFITNANNPVLQTPTPLSKANPIHPPLVFFTYFDIVSSSLAQRPVTKPNFHKADYDVINNILKDTDWQGLLFNLSAETSVGVFYDKIYEIIKKKVPTTTTKSSHYPTWFTPSLKRTFRNKSKAWIKWKIYGNSSDYEIFANLRKSFKSQCEICYNNYMNSIQDSIRINIKYFWKFISDLKNKPGIPSKINLNNHSANTPTEISNLFSDFFNSVYEPSTFDKDTWSPPQNYADNSSLISNINISLSDIFIELKKLDQTKGAGPDGIHPLFLKNTAQQICIPLHIIYNKCLVEGVFPDIWKQANITPVYKSGAKDNVSNYRPISILSTLSKLFERLVHNKVYPTLHGTIIEQQHGFVKRRSTCTNLMIFTNYLFESMDRRIQVSAVYTDFQKAFDKVDHEILLNKLAYNGIRGDLLRWFISYITNRTQKVVVYGHQSDEVNITSGVPQGSILGPLLFILFINDISQCFLHSNFLLYADDLKIYRHITNPYDCILLQEDLNRLTQYCSVNKLHLSIPKCNFIVFSKNHNLFKFIYRLCNATLNQVDSLRDLGVVLDCKLNLDLHAHKIKNKAFQMLGFISRIGKYFKRPTTYLHLYNALVRPQIEYVTQVWNPYYLKYIDSLERVQKKFLRITNYRCSRGYLKYSELLTKYNFLSLKQRRMLLGAMMLYNLCHNRFDCTQLTGKLCYSVPRTVHRRAVRPGRLFVTTTCRTNAGVRAPIYQLVNSYNTYFDEIDIFALSVGQFKKAIIRKILSL